MLSICTRACVRVRVYACVCTRARVRARTCVYLNIPQSVASKDGRHKLEILHELTPNFHVYAMNDARFELQNTSGINGFLSLLATNNSNLNFYSQWFTSARIVC